MEAELKNIKGVTMKNLKIKLSALIIIVVLIATLGGCGVSDGREADRVYGYRVIENDGCEYIIFWDNKPNMAVVHKGNCKNPIHKTE